MDQEDPADLHHNDKQKYQNVKPKSKIKFNCIIPGGPVTDDEDDGT
jgi:hypothetical protein